MEIKVKYTEPEKNVLEICFYRGNILLHNIFYDIDGLDEQELNLLKKEAIAKFFSVFPEISASDIMKGFEAVDSQIYKLYEETYKTSE